MVLRTGFEPATFAVKGDVLTARRPEHAKKEKFGRFGSTESSRTVQTNYFEADFFFPLDDLPDFAEAVFDSFESKRRAVANRLLKYDECMSLTTTRPRELLA